MGTVKARHEGYSKELSRVEKRLNEINKYRDKKMGVMTLF